MQTPERIATPTVIVRTDFVHWTPVIAGALVASALSLVLIAFGGSLGLSVASTAPTWRDNSRSSRARAAIRSAISSALADSAWSISFWPTIA